MLKILRNYPNQLILIIFAIVLIQFIIAHIKVLLIPSQDFTVFYFSGKQILLHLNPYARITQDIVRNPPPALLLYTLISILPFTISQFVWFFVSMSCFIIASIFLGKLIKKSPGIYLWAAYLTLVFIFFPFRYNLGSGQINNFLLLFIVLAFYFFQRNRHFWGGLFLALGILIKLTPVLLIFVLLLQKKYSSVSYTLINICLVSVLTALVLGPDVFLNYLAIPSSYLDFVNTNYSNQSLSSLIIRIYPNPQISEIISLSILSLSLLPFIYFIRKLSLQDMGSNLLTWSLSIIYMLILAPFAWRYHFVIIIFSLVVTFYLGITKKCGYKFLFLLCLSYLLLAFNIKNPALLQNSLIGAVLLSHAFFGGLLLLFLNYYLIMKCFQKK